ncbi:hypothetical protein Tco_1344861 [Tanacetum coccineum]
MRTRSQARISVPEPPVRQPSVESSNLEKPDNPPIVTMADNRTMAQLLEAPHRGFTRGMRYLDRFNDTFKGMPSSMGFQNWHQLDTILPNALNSNDQDSLNSAARTSPQTHGVSKTDFERYVTANDAVLRNMQNQGQNLQSQMANLTDMLSKFVTANDMLLLSGSGTLSGNSVTEPKED